MIKSLKLVYVDRKFGALRTIRGMQLEFVIDSIP